MTTIDELLEKSTADGILESLLSGAEALGVPVRSWRIGGALRVLYRVSAGLFFARDELALQIAMSQFLPDAAGGWLELLARHVYGVEKVKATFATGEVTLTNVGSNFYTFDADEIQFKNPTTGKVYSFTGTGTPETMNPGDSKIFPVRAVEEGSASSTAEETITDFETVFTGLSVVNAASVLGGDGETDDELRARCLAKLGTHSLAGPQSAYEYAVLSAVRPDGSAVDINRHAVAKDPSTGIMTITVASPSGTPDPLDIEYIEDNIEEIARPEIVSVVVQAASTVTALRTVTIWARSTPGVTASEIEDAVSSAVDTALSSYPIGGLEKPPAVGGYLYEDYIKAIAINAHPSVYEADGFGPDLALTSSEVGELTTTYTIRIV